MARKSRSRSRSRSSSRASSRGSRAKSRSSSSRVRSLGTKARSRSSSSRVRSLGTKARSRSSSSHVGSLGSRARSRSSSSHVGSLGSRARSRSSSSHVGSLGSRARSSSTRQKSTTQPFQREQYRIRRARQRGYHSGIGYPRRYRTRPMSSCGCFTVFIILAIFWLIFLAPSITINLDATLSLVLPIIVVIGLFIVALCFITRITDDGDEYDSSREQVKVIERERILVVCPYCGAKNEQGITTCKNCGAEI